LEANIQLLNLLEEPVALGVISGGLVKAIAEWLVSI
jgi:hypothetical protein